MDNYDAIGIVERLAQALDEEDYATASACLEADAEYDDGEEFALDHTMRVALSERGLVKSLQLIFPPGERERLADFLRKTADDWRRRHATDSAALV